MELRNQFAVWDTHPYYTGTVLSVQVDEPTAMEELHRWHRTRLYDEAEAQRSAGRPLGALTGAIREDYQSRCRAFGLPAPRTDAPAPAPAAPKLTPRSRARRGKSRAFLSYWAPGFDVLGVAIAYSAFVLVFTGGVSLFDLTAALVVYIVLRSIPWLRRHEDNPLPIAALRLHDGECGDCGYDLAGTPPALPVEVIGVNVGPKACPECGAPWPLVPPSPKTATGVYPGPSPS